MKFEINVEKRHLYILSVLVVLIGGVLFVKGANGNFGHDANDVYVMYGEEEKSLQEAIDGGYVAGSVFIRWGRTECPNGTELVYDGYTAGNHYLHGGGDTTLCLTKDPTWGVYDDANDNGNLIYGTEYEMNIRGLTSIFKGHHNYDAPCAVCLAQKSSVFMYPGSMDCPDGWDVLYSGYLMSEYYQHTTADTVCVDENAEYIEDTGANDNGNLWYPTEGECGSLPCPPYVQNREMTCSVCGR